MFIKNNVPADTVSMCLMQTYYNKFNLHITSKLQIDLYYCEYIVNYIMFSRHTPGRILFDVRVKLYNSIVDSKLNKLKFRNIQFDNMTYKR